MNSGLVGYEDYGDTPTFWGLDPDSYYSYEWFIETENGDSITGTTAGRTEAIVFETLPAKATSNTRAVICAQVNLVNEESGVGFEWRRIDAPDLVPSSYSPCAVHDGVIEGVLSNLSASTYYKYRPYYCSSSGKYYYGEWIGFGTADAYVYFTPTVHTYEATSTAANSVRLRGYALAGSDDIKEQGFEYWADGMVTRAANSVATVTATGQRMEVLLEGLEYGTVYKYRAYVKTATETVYGEEMSFETEWPTGVDNLHESAQEIVVKTTDNGCILVLGAPDNAVVRIFSLQGNVVYSGTESEIPVAPGMYIVKVADCTKKLLVK